MTFIIDRVAPYTMTDPERVAGLIRETMRIIEDQVAGAMVECGVWRGGSMMAIALTLLQKGISDRELYLFDTYQGMTPPEDVDVDLYGHAAKDPKSGSYDAAGCAVGLPDVQAAMRTTGYPQDRVHYAVGKVEDTLPSQAPCQIALLHLDTDWYRSTRHEMEQLFPRVAPGGCIICDDYGHWKGARKAVDEYLDQYAPSIVPIHCGYTAVILRKA
jgi:O-methyltransferase